MNKIKIKPHYVAFNTAKWLVDIGFDYHEIFEDFADYYDYNVPNEYHRRHNSDLSTVNYPDISKWIPIPEQHQVLEYLFIKYNIWIVVQKDWDDGVDLGYEAIIEERDGFHNTNTFNSPQEAYSEAFDYIRTSTLIKL